VVSRFVYTDALQIVLLLLNLVLLVPLVVEPPGTHDAGRRESWRFWAIGLSMAALFNTKYNAYLYGLVLFITLWLKRRSLFSDRRTWWAVGLAACGLLPVLIWNAGHDWASFRWQFQHFGTGTVFRSDVLTNVAHAIRYLTPPLVLVGALGVARVRGLERQMLLFPALALILPVLLGPTDSPRNLLTGVALLLVLTGDLLDPWIARRKRLAWPAIAVGLLITGVYGLGTVVETMQPSVLPSSPVGHAIRVDSAGWRAVGPRLASEAEVFALDYSIASQLTYYSGRPVHTAWGQYRLWGIPAICGPDAPKTDVQIVALGFLDPALVTQRLSETFEQVQGPVEIEMGEGRALRTWSVRGCTVAQDVFLERFDFLALVEAGGGP
jgi:hypothetical protein